MKLIQFFLLFTILLTMIVVRQKKSYFSRAYSRFGFLLVTVLSLIAICFPNTVQDLAEILGVGRGADLLIYFNVVTIFSLALLIFVKIKQIEAREAIVVREIALQKSVEKLE